VRIRIKRATELALADTPFCPLVMNDDKRPPGRHQYLPSGAGPGGQRILGGFAFKALVGLLVMATGG
jgi:hypothetical protein